MLHTGNPEESGANALTDSQGWFKQLFELSPDPTWIIDGNRFVECNEAAVTTLGYPSRAELLNVHPSKLSPPTQPDGQRSYDKAERMMALAQADGLHRFEWTHTKADGTDFVAEVTLSAIQLSDRQVIYCVWRDITERKQAETMLRESHERYSNLVEDTADLITSVDAEGRFVFVNKSAQIVLGLAPQECIGLSAFDFVHPEDRQTTQAAFRQWVECPRQTLSFENRQVSRSGAERVMQWSVVARHLPTGEIYGFDSVARDITERKQVEAALREATRRWQTTFDNTLDAICWLSSDQKILQANASMAALTGISVENMIGKHCWEVVHGTTAAIPQCPLKRARTSLIREQIELQLGNRWLKVIVDPVLGEAREFQGAVHIIRDITKRKQAEEALRESEEGYRALVEWSPVAIAVHRAGQLAYVNPAGVKMIGAKSAQDLVGKPMLDWVHPDFRQIVLARVKISFELGITQPPVEETFLKVDGSAIDVVVKSTPIIYNGTPAVQVVIRDITESKQMEQQVRELAFYDPLTQLPNRRLLGDRLGQTLAESKRSGCYGALIFLDLDNFKTLNDSRGHAVGDLLLVQAAKRMKSCVRAVDTVARFGGDEFVVMVGDLTENKAESSAQASSIAEHIRSALAEPYALTVKHEGKAEATVEHRCTASIGVVVFIDGEGSQEDFLRWADSAMYQAKDAGSNLIRFYKPAG